MPKDSKVEEVYQALRSEGKSKESAAKIAQAQTGEALATGKPTENMAFMNGRTRALEEIENKYKRGCE